jgi:hypothetical protein
VAIVGGEGLDLELVVEENVADRGDRDGLAGARRGAWSLVLARIARIAAGLSEGGLAAGGREGEIGVGEGRGRRSRLGFVGGLG